MKYEDIKPGAHYIVKSGYIQFSGQCIKKIHTEGIINPNQFTVYIEYKGELIGCDPVQILRPISPAISEIIPAKYGCGCGRSIDIGQEVEAGWKRKLMIGCIVWVCPVCLPTLEK
jgi:hypothetical protein